MIKKLLSSGLIFMAFLVVNGQSFNLVYEFNSVSNSPSTGTVDPTPAPTAVGVTSGSFTANNLSANPTTTNVFAFTNWALTSIPDQTKYFELILTPQFSYFLSLDRVTFYTTRSAQGPQNWCVKTNLDNYTANAAGSTSLISANSTGSIITVNGANEFVWGTIPTSSAIVSSAWKNNCQVSFANASNVASAFKMRFYGYNAISTSGSYRVDSVVVYGSATFSVGAGLASVTHDVNATFLLYPNPSNDGVVYLVPNSLSNGSIEVANMLGEVVAREENASKLIKLNLAVMPKGTYFVKFTSEGKIRIEKLIISN